MGIRLEPLPLPFVASINFCSIPRWKIRTNTGSVCPEFRVRRFIAAGDCTSGKLTAGTHKLAVRLPSSIAVHHMIAKESIRRTTI